MKKDEPLIPPGERQPPQANFTITTPRDGPMPSVDPALSALANAVRPRSPAEDFAERQNWVREITKPPGDPLECVEACGEIENFENRFYPPIQWRATAKLHKGRVQELANFRFQGDGRLGDDGKPLDDLSMYQPRDAKTGTLRGPAICGKALVGDPEKGIAVGDYVWPPEEPDPKKRRHLIITQIWHRALGQFSGRPLPKINRVDFQAELEKFRASLG